MENLKISTMKIMLIYLLILILKVNTIVNTSDNENFYNCIKSVENEFSEKPSAQNLIELIEQNTVILKAFCSENLISFVVDNNNEDVLENITTTVAEPTNDNDLEFYDGNDDEYSDNYEYSSRKFQEKNMKILLTFAPETIFKGTSILRKLELFNSQEYFVIKGDLNATIELSTEQRAAFKQRCFNNDAINTDNIPFNENHLIEQHLRKLLPGQLVVFATFHKNNLVVRANHIMKWNLELEEFLWNHLGWSKWSEWGHCSASCNRGIQQRHRYCSRNYNQGSDEMNVNVRQSHKRINKKQTAGDKQMDSLKTPITLRAPETISKQQFCDGYNIEQRDCNLFKCGDAINLLPLFNDNQTNSVAENEISLNINQIIDRNNFTLMFRIRSKLSKRKFFEYAELKNNYHLFSLRSKYDKETTFSISFIEEGLKIQQEKYSMSEMLIIKFNLFNLQWHQIALSIRTDGIIICYIDCIWNSSFLLSKGSFELPKQPIIELNPKLKGLIEWTQLTLIAGNHEKKQCLVDRMPISDNNQFLLQQILNSDTDDEKD